MHLLMSVPGFRRHALCRLVLAWAVLVALALGGMSSHAHMHETQNLPESGITLVEAAAGDCTVCVPLKASALATPQNPNLPPPDQTAQPATRTAPIPLPPPRP